MNFRWKMQILLLVIALAPLALVAGLYHLSTRELGNRLAANSQQLLTEKASRLLQRLVTDYGRILDRDRLYLELTLKTQAREVERRLAAPPPVTRPRFIDGDSQGRSEFTRQLTPSRRHIRVNPDGQRTSMSINLHDQVLFLAGKTPRSAVPEDLRRLAGLTETYRFGYGANPRFLLWTYTGLESGVFSSYPGVTGIPADFDHRLRNWYQQARARDALVWVPPYVDVFTRSVLLTLAMPVHDPDGSFAGVVGIDVAMQAMFEELQLPEDWTGHARTFIVTSAGSSADGLKVLAQKNYQNLQQPWQVPLKLALLKTERPAELGALLEDARGGRPGVRRMTYQGRSALWAHGSTGPGEAFPVIIVPEDVIIARAAETRDKVIAITNTTLHLAAVILLVVVGSVTLVAFFSSRSVTRPVTRIAAAAADLGRGNYQSQVQIRTGDELQQLGEAFNDIGPKLQEREKMQRALALAKEVQQHLLPLHAPRLAGFQVFGDSRYCDETGGDYYDFIDARTLGEGRLGIAVGDVSGHGIGAALLMASARAVLHARAGHHFDDLAAILASLNLHLNHFSAADQFMTLFYAVLSAEDRSFIWASAGHGPCFHLHGDSGAIEELPTTGIPLGILEATGYRQAGPLTLAAGDIVLIGTDGIWEARNPDDEMYGVERLRGTLHDHRDRSAEQIYTAIMDSLADFRGGRPQDDDITLVVIRAEALPAG